VVKSPAHSSGHTANSSPRDPTSAVIERRAVITVTLPPSGTHS
jgi:hypothetical protein